MRAFKPTSVAVVGCVVLGLLITAPAAFADRITYTVSPRPAYTLQDNGNGIVQLTYNGCITAASRVALNFTMLTSVQRAASGTVTVLKEEGANPTVTFTPPVVQLVPGPDQSFKVAVAFTIDNANNGVTAFRIKLDAANGSGLGEGPGIMVRIPCVLAAPLAPRAPAPPGAPAPPAPVLVAPTTGVFPATGNSRASGLSPCLTTPTKLRLRARERTRVVVTVVTNGQRIQGARVRASYPGAQYAKTTDANGRVVFSIKPTRSGRLVLQSDVCFGAQRFAVRKARVVARRRPARVTG